MKRLYKLLLTVLVLTPLLGRAQESQQQKSTTFTLDQCIEYALQNSISVKNAIVGEEIALAKVRETRGIGLPQVSATASIVNNPKLPRFFSKYDTAGAFAPKEKEAKEAIANLGVKQGDITASKNFFQLPTSGNASATVNQMIFNGSYFVGLQASKTYKELATSTTNQTKEQVVQLVTKAYYNVLINNERLSLFTSNIARVDSLLKSTIALNKNGFAEEIDVDRIQVTLNNLVAERDKFASLNSLGYDLLKYQMNYPIEDEIAVVGSIEDVQISTAPEEDFNIKQRPDYQVLLVNQKLQELNIKNLNAATLPTLNAFFTYGYNTQSPDIAGVFKTTSKFKDVGTIGPDSWYSYSQLGVSLNVPIFSGFQHRYKLQQEKLSLQRIQNGFVNLESAAKLEVKQARISYDNALKSLMTQQANRDLATKISKVTRIKYEQGVGSNIEVVDAENSLRQANTNYYSALFDVMVAKVDLDKAYGKLAPQTQNK